MALQNLFGNLGLDETLQKIAHHLGTLANTFSRVYPNTDGSIRVSGTGGTISTVSTVSNIAANGGFNAQYDQYAQVQSTIAPIRNQINVS